MTPEQQLIEEAALLSDLLNQFTAQQIESVPRIRALFRILKERLSFCEKCIREGV